MLEIADRFEMDYLMDACSRFLADNWANRNETCLEALSLAHKYHLYEAAKVALPRTVYQQAAAFEAYNEDQLPSTVKMEIWRNQQELFVPRSHYAVALCFMPTKCQRCDDGSIISDGAHSISAFGCRCQETSGFRFGEFNFDDVLARFKETMNS